VRLRQIFLLFVCASVGLATNPNLLSALEPAIATAVVIGLVQEVVELARSKTRLSLNSDIRFARFFAIAWRTAVTITLVALLTFNLLTARQFVSYPDRNNILTFETAAYALSLCIVVTILASVERWRLVSRVSAARRRYLDLMLALLAIVITLLMVMEGTTLDYLVHLGCSNIENAQNPRWHRPGVYISLEEENFRPLWLAFLAVLCLGFAAVNVSRLRSTSTARGTNRFKLGVVVCLLLFPVVFCYWYYEQALERLSPEIAGAGLAMITFDLVAAIWVGSIIVTAGAYKLARTETVELLHTGSNDDLGEYTPLYESLPCLAMLVGHSLYALGMWVYDLFFAESAAFMIRPWNLGLLISTLSFPGTLFIFASALASFQLCWFRWKARNQSRPNKLFGLAPATFGQAWLALALLLAVAVPTLRAFAFILWLGPIDFMRVFGLR
jgi:hypothetical protein